MSTGPLRERAFERALTTLEHGDTLPDTMTVTRRVFITSAFALLGAPFAATAQHATKVYRVGLVSLGGTDPSLPGQWWNPFLGAMRELGYVEGTNLMIKIVTPAGVVERLPGLVRDVVRDGVDVFVTTGARETRAVMDAAPTIPTVMTLVPDPVTEGFVKTLARPGGYVTGMTNLISGLSQKYLELLKEAVPRLSKVTVVARAGNATLTETRRELEAAATVLGLGVVVTNVGSLTTRLNEAVDFQEILKRAQGTGVGGIIAIGDPLTYFHRRRLAQAALDLRLPGMFWSRDYVDEGGLMAYSADLVELRRRAAAYVDKILKGARPGELPVERPTKFELVVNLKTAKALGLTLPRSLLLRADQLIE